MKLQDIEIYPGVCIDVSDPKHIGRVKANAPALFNPETMSKEGLPWIYPFTMNGYQGFSKLTVGSKIWIFLIRPIDEFWYLPMFELHQDTRDIISEDESDYEESEVLISRNMGSVGVYMYFSPSKGIMMNYGDNSKINITPNNEIFITSGNGNITIKNNEVYIGDKKAIEDKIHAADGDTVKKALSTLAVDLGNFAQALNSWPYTNGLGVLVSEMQAHLSSYLENVPVKHTFVN